MSCYGLKLFGKDIVNIFKHCARLLKIAQPSIVNLDQDMHSAQCTDSNVQEHLPPTPGSPSALSTNCTFCTHTVAGQRSVCNVTIGANIHDGGVHDQVPSWRAPPFHMHLNLLVRALLAPI